MDSWRIGTYLSQTLPCFSSNQKSISGILVTNATVFSRFPPIWNAESATLEYKIASPHFDPTGKVFSGEYRIILRESIANCLWSTEASQSKAQISIINQDGTTQVSTTTMNTKDGFVYLSATGFHYSQSTVKVKLISNSLKTRSLICTKGKATKKVTGTKPKCPAGYKLKSS